MPADPQPASPVVAAIDCGTNSLRLLVARLDGGRLVDIDRRMLTVRLGEGVDRTGRLSEAALARAFAGCREYHDAIVAHGADRVRFVATSATRDAENAGMFTEGVADILGVVPEVISGPEEAQLSFEGATRGRSYPDPQLIFDIGGGSTEFVLGEQDRAGPSISVDMGCVRYTERFVRHDPMTPGELRAVRAAADEQLDLVTATVPVGRKAVLIGLAGTVTTVVALGLRLPEYDATKIHGAAVPADEVARVAAELAGMTAGQRAALPVMHPGRADVIAVGAAILDRIVRRSGASELVASEHDILDGIAWSLLDARRHPAPIRT